MVVRVWEFPQTEAKGVQYLNTIHQYLTSQLTLWSLNGSDAAREVPSEGKCVPPYSFKMSDLSVQLQIAQTAYFLNTDTYILVSCRASDGLC